MTLISQLKPSFHFFLGHKSVSSFTYERRLGLSISARVSVDSDSRTNEDSTLSPGSVTFDDSTSSGTRVSSAATESTLHQFPELSARHRRVMRGDLEQRLTAKAKIIRIFTSSTFTGSFFRYKMAF